MKQQEENARSRESCEEDFASLQEPDHGEGEVAVEAVETRSIPVGDVLGLASRDGQNAVSRTKFLPNTSADFRMSPWLRDRSDRVSR